MILKSFAEIMNRPTSFALIILGTFTFGILSFCIYYGNRIDIWLYSGFVFTIFSLALIAGGVYRQW